MINSVVLLYFNNGEDFINKYNLVVISVVVWIKVEIGVGFFIDFGS